MAMDKRWLKVCLVSVGGFCLNSGHNNIMGNSQNISVLFGGNKMLHYMTYLLNPRHNMANNSVFLYSTLQTFILANS